MRRIRHIWSMFSLSLSLSFSLFGFGFGVGGWVLEFGYGCADIKWYRVHKLREELCEDTLAYDLEFEE